MRRSGRLGWIALLLGVAVGCGDQKVADFRQQEGNLRTHYELAKQAPTKLTAKEKRIRQERLRMQFGDMATE
ncbi:MAG: hypothetical protein ABS79_02430 [Planctomycetes bacterium SCN 63-9]|nr:MAG: hypothetical protein ABS79_02430 [Planctomycetes bacterium SCN 63-9]